MSKTQINAWLPAPEGREKETIQMMSQILQDDDIEFGISTVASDGEAGMKMVYLDEDLKDVPIMLLKMSMPVISKGKTREKVEEYFSKLAYQFRKEPLKSMISYPNKQYFVPTQQDGDIVEVVFLNNGKHTEDQVKKIKERISKLSKAVLDKPTDFYKDYFNEISDKEPDMNLALDKKGSYRMLHKNEHVTEWTKFDPVEQTWDEFIEMLYQQYKVKVGNE